MRDTNCRNCGAPVKGNRCEYCGTEYGDESKARESYIHVTLDGIKIGVVDRLESAIRNTDERRCFYERYT